jgi:hypothetical protein
MKALKYLLFAGIVGTGFALTTAHAADEDAPAKMERKRDGQNFVDARVAQIDKAVGGLTADQTAKIKEIMASYSGKMREEGADRRALSKAMHDEIRAVLTADQQPKFDAMPQGRQGGGRGKRKSQE